MKYRPVLQGLEGKVAIVTGGASGIGAAVVDCLTASGAIVESLDAGHTNESPTAHRVDVSAGATVRAVTQALMDVHGRCDILVNCAGVNAVGSVVDTTDEAWERVFAVNVGGIRNLCRYLIPHMGAGSSIVNVASAAGIRAIGNMPAYVASKSAVVGLTKALAIDHAAQGIRANCVCPGLVDTAMYRESQMQRKASERESVASFANYLVKRHASADELAASICFLASDSAQYITGATLAVDGGRSLH